LGYKDIIPLATYLLHKLFVFGVQIAQDHGANIAYDNFVAKIGWWGFRDSHSELAAREAQLLHLFTKVEVVKLIRQPRTQIIYEILLNLPCML
jgi:hypothetical protein